MLLLLLLLLIACINAKFDPNQSFQLLGDTFSNTITLTGTFLQNITHFNVTNNNNNVVVCTVISSKTDPCRIKHQRYEATAALGILFANPGLVLNQTCENGEPCKDENTFTLGACPALNPNICRYVRAYAKLESPTIPSCYAFGDIDLTNYTCGPNLYCNSANKTCSDARGNECHTTVTCQLPPMSAGVYSIENTVNITVYPYPYITNISTASNSATNTSLKPLYASPDTAVVGLDIWTEIESNYTFTLFLDNSQVGSVFPYVNSTNPTLFIRVTFWPSKVTFTGSYGGLIVFYQKPILYSICPALALSFINSTVVVQGAAFVNQPLLSCRFGDSRVPMVFISENVVHCIIYPTNNMTANIPLSLTNDGVSYSQTELYVTIIGSCDIVKPHSIPINNECACLPGYQDIGGDCIPCPDGTFQPLHGQQACISCDSTESTNGTIGNTDKSKCMCKDGKYRATIDSVACDPCPQGLDCPAGRPIVVLSGYWRPYASDLFAVKCNNVVFASACSGGTGYGDALCEKGYEGPLCAVCSSGYGKLNGKCTACQSPSLNVFIVILIILVVIAIVLLITRYTTMGDYGINDKIVAEKGDDHTVINKNRIGMAIKIILSYMTILYYIGGFSSGWSSESQQFFNIFIPVSISTNFISFTCAISIDFYTHMLLTMLLPLFIVISMAVIFLAANVVYDLVKQPNRKFIQYTFIEYVSMTLIVLYMVHPTIALEILRSFKCQSVKGTGTSYMTDNMAVDCETAAYKQYVVAAALYFVVYIIGSCLWMGYLIRKNTEGIKAVMRCDTDPMDVHRKYKYFVQGYSGQYYYWECFILLRKLCIVAASSLLNTGLQLVWASVVIIVSITATLYISPYKKIIDHWYIDGNKLDTIALSALWITVILGFHSVFIGTSSGIAVFVFLVLVNLFAFSLLCIPLYLTAKEIAAFVKVKRETFKWKSATPSQIEMHTNPQIQTFY